MQRYAKFVPMVALLAGAAHAEEFQITIENLSNNVLTPAPFFTHGAGFDLFDAGAAASAEVELVAEGGDNSGVLALAGGSADVSNFAVAGGAPIGPGGSASVTLTTTSANPYLSFLSMLAITNDAFIGWAYQDGAIDLFDGGSASGGVYLLTDADVWDGGTEVNDELAANVPALGGFGSVDENGVITAPHAGIVGNADVGLDRNWIGGDVARITVTVVPAPGAALALVGLPMMARRRR